MSLIPIAFVACNQKYVFHITSWHHLVLISNILRWATYTYHIVSVFAHNNIKSMGWMAIFRSEPLNCTRRSNDKSLTSYNIKRKKKKNLIHFPKMETTSHWFYLDIIILQFLNVLYIFPLLLLLCFQCSSGLLCCVQSE